jgi:hypothetical protein
MRFKANADMKSNPDFHLDANLEPVGFKASVGGSVVGKISSISAGIEEIPVRMAIPFLKSRRRHPVVGSVGGFNFKLKPISVQLEKMAIDLDGMLGTEGIKAGVDGKVGCNTEMNMEGKVLGKLGTVTLTLGDDDEE